MTAPQNNDLWSKVVIINSTAPPLLTATPKICVSFQPMISSNQHKQDSWAEAESQWVRHHLILKWNHHLKDHDQVALRLTLLNLIPQEKKQNLVAVWLVSVINHWIYASFLIWFSCNKSALLVNASLLSQVLIRHCQYASTDSSVWSSLSVKGSGRASCQLWSIDKDVEANIETPVQFLPAKWWTGACRFHLCSSRSQPVDNMTACVWHTLNYCCWVILHARWNMISNSN